MFNMKKELFVVPHPDNKYNNGADSYLKAGFVALYSGHIEECIWEKKDLLKRDINTAIPITVGFILSNIFEREKSLEIQVKSGKEAEESLKKLRKILKTKL